MAAFKEKRWLTNQWHWVTTLSMSIMLLGCSMSDTPSKTQLHSAYGSHSADMNANGNIVFLATKDDKLEIWDVNHYAPVKTWVQSIEFPANIAKVALSPSGQYAAATTHKRIIVWNVKKNEPIGYWKSPIKLTSVALSNDGKYALVTADDKIAYYVDVIKSKPIFSLKHANKITTAALSQDGHYALTGSYDKTAILWDLKTGRPVHTWIHPTRLTKVAISPDNKMIMTAAYNDKIRIWNAHSANLKYTLETLPIIVSAAAFSSDGNYLATGTDPQILYIWDMNNGELVGRRVLPKEIPWKPTVIRIHAVAFSQDGKHVMTEDSSGKYHLWPLVSQE